VNEEKAMGGGSRKMAESGEGEGEGEGGGEGRGGGGKMKSIHEPGDSSNRGREKRKESHGPC